VVRTLRDAKLDSRSGRADLKPSPSNPYWLVMAPSQAIGYNKPKKGAGTWRARLYLSETRTFKMKVMGTADDFQDANGSTILNFKQAQAAAGVWFQEYADEATRIAGGEPAMGTYTVGMALDDYFLDAKRRGVKGIAKAKISAQAWLYPELGPVEVAKLTRRRIETWQTKMAESARKVRQPGPAKESNVKPRNFKIPRVPKPKKAPPAPPSTEDEKRARKDTANRILTILKAALNHALDRRRVRNGEAWDTVKPFPGVGKSRILFLSIEDQVRLVNACPSDFRRLVQGALLTGGRYGELSRARVMDFDATAGTLYLIGKGTGEGKPRHVVLTEEGQALFTELTAGRKSDERLFMRNPVVRETRTHLGDTWGANDQTRLMEKACKDASLDYLNFHQLRHSYASMLVNKGVPLAFVAAQLGHSDTRMVTLHYGHLAPSALADSIRALMPNLGIMGAAKIKPLAVQGNMA